jgi:hypothetical protein
MCHPRPESRRAHVAPEIQAGWYRVASWFRSRLAVSRNGPTRLLENGIERVFNCENQWRGRPIEAGEVLARRIRQPEQARKAQGQCNRHDDTRFAVPAKSERTR